MSETLKPPDSPLFNIEEEVAEILSAETPEEKLERAVASMERSLGGAVPSFKGFWEIRQKCQELLQESEVSEVRTRITERMTELTEEAKRLRNVLSEQSLFAEEQVGLAITGLEEELADLASKVESINRPVLDPVPSALADRIDRYQLRQALLNVLNAYASRIHSLRKELSTTRMRIKTKNRFFQRLSDAGNLVFPQRKELIAEMSQEFLEDVERFSKEHFRKGAPFGQHLVTLRNEVKALQGAAKTFTINTSTFKSSREILSRCWSLIQEADRARREEMAVKRAGFQEIIDRITEQIGELTALLEGEEWSIAEAKAKAEAVGREIRGARLPKDPAARLRDQFAKAKEPLAARLAEEEKKRLEAKEKREREYVEERDALLQEIEGLAAGVLERPCDEVLEQHKALTEKKEALTLQPADQKRCQRELTALYDALLDRMAKEKDLPEEQAKWLEEALASRVKRVKRRLEELRQRRAKSGLNIAEALDLDEQWNLAKEQLQRVEDRP